MQLRDALNDYKRHRGEAARFPGERRTTRGLFAGDAGRLVHVDSDGRVRDFGYPLSGLNGIERSRFGLCVADSSEPVETSDADPGEADSDDPHVTWLDDWETVEQSYHADTAMVVTRHRAGDGEVVQYDLTLDDAHLTHFDCDGLTAGDDGTKPTLIAYVGFAPDRQETQLGQLRHDDACEVFHADEHDFFGSATGFADLQGRVPIRFEEVLGPDAVDLPRPLTEGRYEEGRLSGDLVGEVPVESGGATLVTLPTDATETGREAALGRLTALADAHHDTDALVTAAENARSDVLRRASEDDVPDTAVPDLRVVSLLSAETGLRIAGPDFDPFYVYSGGYGYTWFRDDGEISRFLLSADATYDLALADWHARSARMYCRTQCADGSWPHRVWARDGRLAPGWAHGRLEAGDDVDYQADQTGSVVGFLAELLAERGDDLDADLDGEIRETLADALAGLDETLAEDGRPITCQNAWENMTGRFAHTTATFLDAYARLADAPVSGAAREQATESAESVYDAVDDLWVPERGVFALREHDPEAPPDQDHATAGADDESALDDRLDSSTLALVGAHRAYDESDATRSVDSERLDRLVSHVETTIEGLHRETPEIEGLIRFEGDDWRTRTQGREKVWTVSTAWGANAAAELAGLLAEHDDPRAERFAERARHLLSLVSVGGALSTAGGYLPEQFFDDGTPDSATPLGWPHALRLATVARLDADGLLDVDSVEALADD
ncbi:glucan 1,4-alpha-glucosidase [Salinirubrum litoreum]|uniref:Glucan 1,4-alpha-glucosidase n=1 Tax=Salinirubrum litoreum TaxID=1126234 RepID=A0ABD5R6A0_9EURY|nr:glucan 1,4-alpha-glucosidase [Salinirubrum litoreum]